MTDKFSERLALIEQKFQAFSDGFVSMKRTRAEVSSTPPSDREEVGEAIKNFSRQSAASLYKEIGLLGKMANHYLARASYALRFSERIWPNGFEAYMDAVKDDLMSVLKSNKRAEMYLDTAFKQDVDKDKKRHSQTKELMEIYVERVEIFNDARRQQNLHRLYSVSANPQADFVRETEGLANVYLDMAELTNERLLSSQGHISYLLNNAARHVPQSFSRDLDYVTLSVKGQDVAIQSNVRLFQQHTHAAEAYNEEARSLSGGPA